MLTVAVTATARPLTTTTTSTVLITTTATSLKTTVTPTTATAVSTLIVTNLQPRISNPSFETSNEDGWYFLDAWAQPFQEPGGHSIQQASFSPTSGYYVVRLVAGLRTYEVLATDIPNIIPGTLYTLTFLYRFISPGDHECYFIAGEGYGLSESPWIGQSKEVRLRDYVKDTGVRSFSHTFQATQNAKGVKVIWGCDTSGSGKHYYLDIDEVGLVLAE